MPEAVQSEQLADSRVRQSRAPTPSPAPSHAPSAFGEDSRPASKPKQRRKKHPPQKTIDEFWASFNSKTPGKVYTILPDNQYARRAAARAPRGIVPGRNAIASYDDAVRSCEAKVAKIVKECLRLNQKFRDSHFDLEADFAKTHGTNFPSDCLSGLLDTKTSLRPQSVKRVEVRGR